MVGIISNGEKIGKKAIFFTIIAIMLLGVLMLSFTIYTQYRLRAKALVIETRINTMDSFIKDLEKDVNRGLFISTHRSILTLTEYVTSTGRFVDNSTQRITELIINGSINGTRENLIENTTITDWAQKMKINARAINLEVNMTVNNIYVTMSDPWNVQVTMDATILVDDYMNTAKWNITKNISTKVSIIGFEDPIYTVKTNGKLLNAINKTPYVAFVVNDNTINLTNHATNSFYTNWSDAPDFLMRLEGKLNASQNGIESIINFDELYAQGVTVENKSSVDYIYWSSESITSYAINGTISWLRLDEQVNPNNNKTHIDLYQVGALKI